MEAAVAFGKGSDGGVLAEDGCAGKGLTGGIYDLSIQGEGFLLGNCSERNEDG
jgi:hypothetical protein